MESGSGQKCEPPLSGKESPSLPVALKKFYCGEPLALGVKSMLAMNVVSTAVALFGLGFASYAMEFHRRPGIEYSRCLLESDIESIHVCRETEVVPYATLYGIAMILFLFHALLILISFFISVLGCVTLCDYGNSALTTVVVYQTSDAVVPVVPAPSEEVEAP